MKVLKRIKCIILGHEWVPRWPRKQIYDAVLTIYFYQCKCCGERKDEPVVEYL